MKLNVEWILPCAHFFMIFCQQWKNPHIKFFYHCWTFLNDFDYPYNICNANGKLSNQIQFEYIFYSLKKSIFALVCVRDGESKQRWRNFFWMMLEVSQAYTHYFIWNVMIAEISDSTTPIILFMFKLFYSVEVWHRGAEKKFKIEIKANISSTNGCMYSIPFEWPTNPSSPFKLLLRIWSGLIFKFCDKWKSSYRKCHCRVTWIIHCAIIVIIRQWQWQQFKCQHTDVCRIFQIWFGMTFVLLVLLVENLVQTDT